MDINKNGETDVENHEEVIFYMDESLSDGIPKKYKHIVRNNSFAEWEIPPWDLNLKEVIGKGMFGQVHRAHWKGTPVAAKIDNELANEDKKNYYQRTGHIDHDSSPKHCSDFRVC